jgi:hypothetical protein
MLPLQRQICVRPDSRRLRAFPVSAVSQLTSAQNNPYTEMTYLGMHTLIP